MMQQHVSQLTHAAYFIRIMRDYRGKHYFSFWAENRKRARLSHHTPVDPPLCSLRVYPRDKRDKRVRTHTGTRTRISFPNRTHSIQHGLCWTKILDDNRRGRSLSWWSMTSPAQQMASPGSVGGELLPVHLAKTKRISYYHTKNNWSGRWLFCFTFHMLHFRHSEPLTFTAPRTLGYRAMLKMCSLKFRYAILRKQFRLRFFVVNSFRKNCVYIYTL